MISITYWILREPFEVSFGIVPWLTSRSNTFFGSLACSIIREPSRVISNLIIQESPSFGSI